MVYDSPNKVIRTRFTPEDKAKIMTEAHNHGATASEVIRQLVAVWMGEPDAVMPDGPWREANAGRSPVTAHR